MVSLECSANSSIPQAVRFLALLPSVFSPSLGFFEDLKELITSERKGLILTSSLLALECLCI